MAALGHFVPANGIPVKYRARPEEYLVDKALVAISVSLLLFPFWYLHLLMALDDFDALVIRQGTLCPIAECIPITDRLTLRVRCTGPTVKIVVATQQNGMSAA